MPANYSHHPAKLLAILVGLALVGAIIVVASMQSGMKDIRNDDPAYQTVAPETSTAGPRIVGHVQTSDLAEAYPPPRVCQTAEDEGFTEYDDGTLVIESTGCRLDGQTLSWSKP